MSITCAYKDGWDNGFNNISDNPFDVGTENYNDWLSGYNNHRHLMLLIYHQAELQNLSGKQLSSNPFNTAAGEAYFLLWKRGWDATKN